MGIELIDRHKVTKWYFRRTSPNAALLSIIVLTLVFISKHPKMIGYYVLILLVLNLLFFLFELGRLIYIISNGEYKGLFLINVKQLVKDFYNGIKQ